MISAGNLKKFVKHLCIVTKHYYERENAKISLQTHLVKNQSRDNLEILNKKINLLLEKESKVAELGIKKKVPLVVQKKIRFLESQIDLLNHERDKLEAENEELRRSIFAMTGQQPVLADEEMVDELRQKIQLLESSYKKIQDDKKFSPDRLKVIKEKIDFYKEQLNTASS